MCGFLGIALIPALDCFLACGMQNPWMWSRYSHSSSLSDRSEGGWGLRETAEVLSSHIHTHSMPPPPPSTLTCTSYTTTNVLHRHQHAGSVVQELQCVLECVHVLTGMHTCQWLHMYMTSLDVCSQISEDLNTCWSYTWAPGSSEEYICLQRAKNSHSMMWRNAPIRIVHVEKMIVHLFVLRLKKEPNAWTALSHMAAFSSSLYKTCLQCCSVHYFHNFLTSAFSPASLP